MGYRLNRLDEPVFMAVPKPMLTEFGIHYELESCVTHVDWALETGPFDMIRRVNWIIISYWLMHAECQPPAAIFLILIPSRAITNRGFSSERRLPCPS